jgi:hypothetical protein
MLRRMRADSRMGAPGRELANKVLAYRLVRLTGPGRRLRPDAPWGDLVAELDGMDPFSALFRLERLGHDLTRAAWDAGGPPRDLFRDARARALPERSLPMLHAGMGLALGERLFHALGRRHGEARIGGALADFAHLCRRNARPGYLGPAWEPLGIIVRLFHAGFAAAVDRAAEALDPELRLCFWHGVGRAIYFLPRYCWPGSHGRAIARCRQEPPDATAARQAVSGFFFAATMVNLRHPWVLEGLLAGASFPADEEAIVRDAFAACLLVRRHTTPDDPAVPALLAHRPAPAHASRWERLVREPAERALSEYYPLLVAAGQLPQLARHHDLAGFTASLAPAEAG